MNRKRLRILQVSTYDVSGGAEKVAWDLFETYRARGHGSWLAVGTRKTDDPDVLAIDHDGHRGRWARACRGIADTVGATSPRVHARLVETIGQPLRTFRSRRGEEDFDFPGTARLPDLAPEPIEVLHCHNLHGNYFDLRALPDLCARIPVFLTLHDTWLLSGHCSYHMGCPKWETGCGDCPDLSIYPALRRDGTAFNWQRKRAIYQRCRRRLHIAAPSRWLMDQVDRSIVADAGGDRRIIPYGVDQSVFRPASREAARIALGLPARGKVLLFAANKGSSNPFKDHATVRSAAIEAARRLQLDGSDEDLLLLCLGGSEASDERIGAARLRCEPFQSDPAVVARYLQAADVFVHGAMIDNFPVTILESLSCGTPVVASAVGGVPEQIRDGENGFLVPAGDVDAMAAKIAALLADDALRRTMSACAAEDAQRRYDLRRQADDYLAWYAQAINGNGAP